MPQTYSLSARAQKAMQNELARFPDEETGGLLLGYAGQEGVAVLEATDGGYQNVIHEPERFAYDVAYLEHLCGRISALYEPQLDLVGVWHKHNSIGEIPFSNADENIHRQLLENDLPCLSILFEKEPPEDALCYQVRVFLLSKDGLHQDVTNRTKWSNT